jgi:hypothetical protein
MKTAGFPPESVFITMRRRFSACAKNGLLMFQMVSDIFCLYKKSTVTLCQLLVKGWRAERMPFTAFL